MMDNSPESQRYDIHFVGLYLDDDAENLKKHSEVVSGRIFSQWWDTTKDAGPRARPAAQFQEDPPTLDTLTVSGNEIKSPGNLISFGFKLCPGSCHIFFSAHVQRKDPRFDSGKVWRVPSREASRGPEQDRRRDESH